ncbi:hypothetical protein N8483_00070 [Synechococcus sp. AH-601-O20]|nr:hypothetical protein [Synechococcus sp. AH-601-O20]
MSQGDKSAPKLGSVPHTKHLNSDDRPWYGLGEGATISQGCKLWAQFNREVQLRELAEQAIARYEQNSTSSSPGDHIADAIQRVYALRKRNF